MPWSRKWKPTPVFLAWKIPWTEEPEGLDPWDCKESDTTEQSCMHAFNSEEIQKNCNSINQSSLLKTQYIPRGTSLTSKRLYISGIFLDEFQNQLWEFFIIS